MKALITGGTGFIGSHLQDKLIELGHEIIILDRKPSKFLNPSSKYIQADICDNTIINKIFSKEKPQIIFHLAAQTQIPNSISHPQEDEIVNIRGMINVLEAAKKHKITKIIYANTGGALYGNVSQKDYPIKEDQIVNIPSSPYGISKLCAEYYLKFYGHHHKINWISLRYSNVYGPRQETNNQTGIISIFTHKMFKGEPPIINGDGSHTRDYIYINDVIEANIRALEYPHSDYFNISSATEVSNKEIYLMLKDNLNFSKEPIFGPTRPGDVQRSSLDNTKAKELLHWTPQTTLEQGIQQTIEYYRSPKKKPKSPCIIPQGDIINS